MQTLNPKLYLFNSQTHAKEEFIPLNSSNIRMYVCGPTLYDDLHIGNARPLVVFDVLYRLLKTLYHQVTYVRNITDIDDKIIERANSKGISSEQLVIEIEKSFTLNLTALNVLSPSAQPCATQYILQMQKMIQTLLDKGFAYIAGGNVLFKVTAFKTYGELSGRRLEDLQVNTDELTQGLKEHNADFALWKPAKPNEPAWDSPWGRGRPGWHIECSAMAQELLGSTFDIHGGGNDLIFPHHENERAQSMAACNTEFMAKYWIHNGFINLNSQKMSKSLGNFLTINDVLKKYNGNVLRLCILMTHYRHPLNFKEELLEQAENILTKTEQILNKALSVGKLNIDNIPTDINKADLKGTPFMAALMDDINTPLAIQEWQNMASQLSKTTSNHDMQNLYAKIVNAGVLLGVLTVSGFSNLLSAGEKLNIEQLIAERVKFKQEKNFQKADEIRQKLLKQDIILEDHKNGTTTWYKKT